MDGVASWTEAEITALLRAWRTVLQAPPVRHKDAAIYVRFTMLLDGQATTWRTEAAVASIMHKLCATLKRGEYFFAQDEQERRTAWNDLWLELDHDARMSYMRSRRYIDLPNGLVGPSSEQGVEVVEELIDKDAAYAAAQRLVFPTDGSSSDTQAVSHPHKARRPESKETGHPQQASRSQCRSQSFSSDFEGSPATLVRSSLVSGRITVRRSLSATATKRRRETVSPLVQVASEAHDSSQTESDSDIGNWGAEVDIRERVPTNASEQEIKSEHSSETSSLAILSDSGGHVDSLGETIKYPTGNQPSPVEHKSRVVGSRKRKKTSSLTLLTTVRHLEVQVKGLKAMLRKSTQETKLQRELVQQLVKQVKARQSEERELGEMLKQIILNQVQNQEDQGELAGIVAQFQSSQDETQKKQAEMNNLLEQMVNEKRVRKAERKEETQRRALEEMKREQERQLDREERRQIMDMLTQEREPRMLAERARNEQIAKAPGTKTSIEETPRDEIDKAARVISESKVSNKPPLSKRVAAVTKKLRSNSQTSRDNSVEQMQVPVAQKENAPTLNGLVAGIQSSGDPQSAQRKKRTRKRARRSLGSDRELERNSISTLPSRTDRLIALGLRNTQ